jgi:hypothetical protein
VILREFGDCSVLDIVGSALDIWFFERSQSHFSLRFIRLFIYLQDVIRMFTSQGADNKRRLNLAASRNSHHGNRDLSAQKRVSRKLSDLKSAGAVLKLSPGNCQDWKQKTFYSSPSRQASKIATPNYNIKLLS